MRRPAVMAVLLTALFLLSAAGWYAVEPAVNPLVREAVVTGDVRLAATIFDDIASTDGRLSIGRREAPISVVAYLAFDDPGSAAFMEGTYLRLMERARDGLVRYYPRLAVTTEDIERRTPAYWKAKALACTPPDAAYGRLYRQLFGLGSKEQVINTADTVGILSDGWLACLHAPAGREMLLDLAEGKHFGAPAMTPVLVLGIDGRDTTVLRGDPSAARLDDHMRRYEVKVGR